MVEAMGYFCEDCEKVMKVEEGMAAVPECCGKEMSLLPLRECSKDPSFAEHARFDDHDEPCDPGLGA